MKKLVVALTAALVLALGVPAMAASGLTIGGELGSDFTYDKSGLSAESYFDFDVKLQGEGGDSVKAVIKLKPWSFGNVKVRDDEAQDMVWDKAPLGDWSNAQTDSFKLQIDKAYLQANGSFWTGGPEVTTTIGDISLNQSDYVAAQDKKGVMIQGIGLGPLSAEAFATFASGSPEHLGLSARGDLEFAEVGGTIVRLDNGKVEFAVDGATQIAGVAISAEYAQDADNEMAYKVRGSVEPIEGVVLSGGYRGADANFAPAMHKTDKSSTYTNEWEDVHDLRTGFDVAVETTQFGTDLKASYDDPKQEAKFEARRPFMIGKLAVNGEYEGTYKLETKELIHEISASTTLNMIPQLENVTLEGGLTIADNAISEYNAAAKYSAPNGIDFGVHYEKAAGQEAEIYGTAGVSVKF